MWEVMSFARAKPISMDEIVTKGFDRLSQVFTNREISGKAGFFMFGRSLTLDALIRRPFEARAQAVPLYMA